MCQGDRGDHGPELLPDLQGPGQPQAAFADLGGTSLQDSEVLTM